MLSLIESTVRSIIKTGRWNGFCFFPNLMNSHSQVSDPGPSGPLVLDIRRTIEDQHMDLKTNGLLDEHMSR